MSPALPSYWMLGANGMGMGPLALYLKASGASVCAWDDASRGPMRALLQAAEIPFTQNPWAAGYHPTLVGHSSAIRPGHPLRTVATTHGAELVRRGELLARVASTKKLVAICGSHGKTTTCGLVIAALEAAGADFGHVLGGLFRDSTQSPARASQGPWLVAEVDESDGTIGAFSPEITVAVNLDWDHPDYYRTEADLEQVFADLFQRTRSLILIPVGSERLSRLCQGCAAKVMTVGPGGDFDIQDIGSTSAHSEVSLAGQWSAQRYHLPVVGAFNRSNAGFALAVAWQVAGRLGAEPLGRWSGIRRRQDILLEQPGLRVVADYAHHPTEIAALLGWLRETATGRLVIVFQPHRHTRTRQYAQAFREALSLADRVLLLPVYAAGEAWVEGGTSDYLMPATQDKFTLIAERRTLLTQLRQDLADKEATVAFVGAGDVDLEARAFAREEADLESFTRGRLSAATVLRRHEPLARHVTLGLGGSAAWYAEPADRHDTSELLNAARALGLPVFVLGRGSNLLVPDEGYAGLVLHPTGAFWTGIEALGNNHFRVGGGVRLKELCGHAARLGISGFEFLEGIPGTIGGSLRMNAGAMGSWIFDRVVSLTWLDAHGIQHEALRTEIEAGYRDCPRLHDTVVMSAVLAGEGAPGPAAVRATMENFAQRRRASQPRDPSAGCVFRNPETAKAGALIDAAGLKDSVVGAARVSPVHANFIVNTGEATAADVITLMRRVRTQVRDQAGVTLEPEILLLGKTWEEVL